MRRIFIRSARGLIYIKYWAMLNCFYYDTTVSLVHKMMLTLKRPRYFYSRWCPRGVPLKKTIFPPEFCNEICTIHVFTIETIIPEKNVKCCTVSKWRPNNRFLFRVASILAKIWKNHFSKGIFQWNLAPSRRTWIDLHYWNNILKTLFRLKMAAKTIFGYCAIMLIYENDGVDLNFFASKEAYPIVRQLEKITIKKRK